MTKRPASASPEVRARVPKPNALFNPVLAVMRARGGGVMASKDIATAVAQHLNLPHELRFAYRPGKGLTQLEYNLTWTRTHLQQAGLIRKVKHGWWELTELGVHALHVDALAILKDGEPDDEPADEADIAAEEPLADMTVAAPSPRSWQAELLDVLYAMDAYAFERLCQRLLRHSGFTEVHVTKRSNDGGIDGYGFARIASLISFPVVFQAKRYRGSVGAPTVRDFRGAMEGRADKGLLITTGNFTAEAMNEASRPGTKVIDLIDGALLVSLLKQFQLGIKIRLVEEITIDNDFFGSM